MFNRINNSKDDLTIFSNQVNPIQLATIIIDQNIYKHIVIDGQHRLHALIRLPLIFDKIEFTFHIQICQNENEAIEKFKTCIKGNDEKYLIDTNILTPYFRESKPYQFKNKLLENYGDYFVKSKKNPYIYNLESFIIELKNNNFFNKYKKKSINNLINLLIKRNNKFYKKKYLHYVKDNNYDLFYKKEIYYIQNKIIFSLKNNNFIDYIKNVKIDKYHKFRKVKQKIPKKLKELVWNKYCNKNELNSDIVTKCPISFCNTKIYKTNFHCGHIISEANGGLLNFNNLKPLCSNCNLSMGRNNWCKYDPISV